MIPRENMHDQNIAIVKSLVSVVWADGVFADKEREMIEALLVAFDADEDEANALRAYAADKRTLDDIPLTELANDDRHVLVQHAVLLTYADGERAEREKGFIRELCKKLGIPDDEAKQLVDIAEARAKRFLHLL